MACSTSTWADRTRIAVSGNSQALGGVTRRHPDVHQDEVGPLLPDQVQQPRRVAALADHVEAGALKQACQTLAQENVIVGQRDPDPILSHLYDHCPPLGNRLQPHCASWEAGVVAAERALRAGTSDLRMI
jgi:hypothetical protein